MTVTNASTPPTAIPTMSPVLKTPVVDIREETDEFFLTARWTNFSFQLTKESSHFAFNAFHENSKRKDVCLMLQRKRKAAEEKEREIKVHWEEEKRTEIDRMQKHETFVRLDSEKQIPQRT